MHGVVSLLDATHYQAVESLWAELAAAAALRAVYVTPFPHFSYHVAGDYDRPALEAVLRDFARTQAPFRVTTTGLGIFTGAAPVVYIPVVRDPALTAFHQALWPRLEAVARGGSAYYAPAAWVPHITLVFGDAAPDRLPDVLRLLGARSFNWDIAVDNLALIYDSGAGQAVHARFALGG
jgi:2'-5' RNA ligase